jgi:molybdopterin-guanine dinucleotide biosynthesis protein
MQRLLEQGNCRIYDIYDGLSVNYVEMEMLARLEGGDRTFINLNTPEEYEHFCRKKEH